MTLWNGRFREEPDLAMWKINSSLSVDQRLADQDVRGTMAWVKALHQAGVLSSEEQTELQSGLEQIRSEFSSHTFEFSPTDEDIHTAVERRLKEIIGPLAGKVHTGRSRNDQVATDFRLWLLDHLPVLETGLRELAWAVLDQAQAALSPHEDSQYLILPGYTHLQRAQPILLSHWWLSHVWPLQRDRDRLKDLRPRLAELPLGSGALAGTSYPIDRSALADSLGFDRPSPNSLDAVSNRDFAAEFLFITALIGIHLSRLAEQVILFCSQEFGFFTLADAFSTGSSLMPQKKNPDIFELTRGKAGTLLGKLTGLLAVLKGLPSAYDKDLQEDKQPVFEAFDLLTELLPVLAEAVRTIQVNQHSLSAALPPALMATDIAEYLVDRGVPFREAHQAAGKAVGLSLDLQKELPEIDLSHYRAIHPAFEDSLYQVFSPQQSLSKKGARGGTSVSAVQEQLSEAMDTFDR